MQVKIVFFLLIIIIQNFIIKPNTEYVTPENHCTVYPRLTYTFIYHQASSVPIHSTGTVYYCVLYTYEYTCKYIRYLPLLNSFRTTSLSIILFLSIPQRINIYFFFFVHNLIVLDDRILKSSALCYYCRVYCNSRQFTCFYTRRSTKNGHLHFQS